MKKYLALLLILFTTLPLFCAKNRFGIPDSAEIRSKLLENWFEAPLTFVRENPAELRKNNIGEEFQVRLEESDTTFSIFVSPQAKINVLVYSDKGNHTIQQDIYPGDAAGSVVVVRDKQSGSPVRIRYYFLKDSDVYVQFSPYGNMAVADLVIFGNYACRGVPTGMPFKKFYTTSIEDVYKITEDKLPWNYVMADASYYHSVQQMIAVIREKLPAILYTPDAIYDDNNELVKISTGKPIAEADTTDGRLYLSSAGFVKWIADGLIEPISGGRLKRMPLVEETVEVNPIGFQGVLSQKYNVYFSLDWIRNISSAVISVYSGKTYKYGESGVDVTIRPFVSSINNMGAKDIVTFVENSGYTSIVLKSLLYVLAATEPGEFYMGAIRETDRTVSPEVKAFNENVVFFPYFREDGKFECAVFMNGREFSLDAFITMHKDDFIYLTRVKSSEQFFPR